MAAHPRSFLVLVALTGCLAGSPRRVLADEPKVAAALERTLHALAARAPEERRREAERLGGSWEEGAPLAHVLTTLAREDRDGGVRTAARAAVERLAVAACGVWRTFLAGVAAEPEKHAAFVETAQMLWQLGAVVTTTDLAAGLSEATADGDRADVLGTTALALREGAKLPRHSLAGLDLLLSGVGARGLARTREMAAACLVLSACVTLRLGTDGAPHPAPDATVDAASWASLLGSTEAWLQETAVSVLAAAGRPGSELLRRMALEGWLPALETLGLGAESVAPLVRERPAPEWQVQRVATLLRLGQRQDLLPGAPGAGASPRALEEYAWICATVAEGSPALARPAAETLAALALGEGRPPTARTVALLALSRIQPLPPAVRPALEALVARALPGGGGPEEKDGVAHHDALLACLALVRGTEAGRETRARLVSELLRRRDDGLREAGRTAEVEVLRVLPRLPSELNPVRRELEAGLDTPHLELETRVALVRLLGRLPSSDAETVARLRALLAEPGGIFATPRDLAAGDPVQQVLELGAKLTQAVEGRRAVVDAFHELGPLAAAAVPDLEALRADPDVALRWRALRALAAIRTP